MTACTETQVVTKVSPRPVAATVSRLTGLLAAKGMKVFAVIDQSEEARGARRLRFLGKLRARCKQSVLYAR